MPRICYVRKDFGSKRTDTIFKANKIILEYSSKGYELTLRQLYYQFVARGFIDNNKNEYKNLGETINDARLAGLIDWDHIVDRTRSLRGVRHFSDPAQSIMSAAYGYSTNKWQNQNFRPEVWIEKDALVGVIERVCNEMDVDYFSCRGYTSQSELWGAGMRLKRYKEAGQQPYVFHLGDHDPSGKDMTRDIEDRFEMFCGFKVKVKRLALNMDQVRQYNPPPNPAKLTDSRADAYIRDFGDDSWELDALEPQVIHDMVEENIKSIRDDDLWNAAVKVETEQRDGMIAAGKKWDTIAPLITNEDRMKLVTDIFPTNGDDSISDQLALLFKKRDHWDRMLTLLEKDLAKKKKAKSKKKGK